MCWCLVWCLVNGDQCGHCSFGCHSRGPEKLRENKSVSSAGRRVWCLGLDSTQAMALWRIPRRETNTSNSTLPPSTPQLKAESWSPGVSRAGLIARLWQKHSAEQSCPQLERVATAELASCQPPSPTYLTHSLGPREELRAVEFCSHLEDRCALGPLPVFRLRKPRFLEVQGVPGSLYPAPPCAMT